MSSTIISTKVFEHEKSACAVYTHAQLAGVLASIARIYSGLKPRGAAQPVFLPTQTARVLARETALY